MEQTYQTTSFQKQSYRYNIAKFLGLKTPDAYLWLYNQVMELIFIKEINNIRKDFTPEEQKRIKKTLNTFLQKSMECSHYTSLLEKDNKTTKQIAERMLMKKTREYSALIYPLIKIFTYLVQQTDLKNVQIPPEQILNAKNNKMPFRPRDEYIGAEY